MNQIMVWPNTVPFNALVLSGYLRFKTRNYNSDYRGRILFYNSSRSDKVFINALNNIFEEIDKPPLIAEHLKLKHIVGEANLIEVRKLTSQEKDYFYQLMGGFYSAQDYGYFFENVMPYENALPAKWPVGVVQRSWTTDKELDRSLIKDQNICLQSKRETV